MTIQTAPDTNTLNAVLQTALELSRGINLDAVTAADLVPLIKAVQCVAAFATAIDLQIQKRAITNGEMLPGVVVKDAITHRKWNDVDAAGALAFEAYGLKAYALGSPAALEKLGDEGKALVAVASYKPTAGKRVEY